MPVKNKKVNESRANYLTTEDVRALGIALRNVSNAFPLTYRTERDFFPLVMMYLQGRITGFRAEHLVANHGKVDFRIGGNKASLLELAVVHRQLADVGDKTIKFPGQSAATQAAPSALRTEVAKLAGAEKAPGGKYLLIVDLRFERAQSYLKAVYEKRFSGVGEGTELIRVVYVCKSGDFNFPLRARK